MTFRFFFFGGPTLVTFWRLEAGTPLEPASGREPSGLKRPEDLQPRRKAERRAPTPGDLGQLKLVSQEEHKIWEEGQVPQV
jgi:hypothetical protein